MQVPSLAHDVAKASTELRTVADTAARTLTDALASSQAMLGGLYDQLSQLRTRMAELQHAAMTGASDAAVHGPRLLDTRSLPHGASPMGTPVIDASRSAAELREHVFTSDL